MLSTKNLYNQDFQIWLNQTIEQLEKGDFAALDIEHLIEELHDLGKSERNALVSNIIILLGHLLKVKIQQDAPETMKISWYNSINEHRARILFQLEETPSLKSHLLEAIEKLILKLVN